MNENRVEVHVLDPTKDYPGEHPYPLAYLIPRAELELDRGEINGWLVMDLLAHIDRLEGVRKYFEDLLLATPEQPTDETEKPRSEG